MSTNHMTDEELREVRAFGRELGYDFAREHEDAEAAFDALSGYMEFDPGSQFQARISHLPSEWDDEYEPDSGVITRELAQSEFDEGFAEGVRLWEIDHDEEAAE